VHRKRLTFLLTTTAMLGFAPAALADTTVSIENGTVGGQSGDYLFVRDTPSLFDEPMDVDVVPGATRITITDAVGKMHAQAPCTISGATALCPNTVDFALLWGGNKNDVIASGLDLPEIWDGDSGNDVLEGGPGSDLMSGGPGNDTLRAGPGNDAFGLEPGHDSFFGEEDRDVVDYADASSGVLVSLTDSSTFNDGPTAEPDRVFSSEVAAGSPNVDTLEGNDGSNTLNGRGGNDLIDGLGGNDRMNGQLGNDALHGGDGVDLVTYEDRTAPVKVSLNNVGGDGAAGESDNVFDDVENLRGGSGDDQLTGQVPGPVHNLFEGNGGADTLNGATGDDSLNGGTGDDTIVGDVGSDGYEGGAGTDTLDYSSRSAVFTEDLTVTLENSLLLDDGGPSDGPLGQRDNAHNIENAVTGAGNDSVTGSPDANDVKTNAGNDSVFVLDQVKDTVDCGDGKDGLQLDFGLDQFVNCEFQIP